MIASRLLRVLPRPSLHLAMLAFVVSVCLAVAAASGARILDARSTALRTAQAGTADLARSLAQHADDAIQGADATLIGLRQLIESGPILTTEPEQLQENLALQSHTLPILHDLFVLDAEGNVVVSSLTDRHLGNYADRPHFVWHQTHTDREAHLDGPRVSKIDGSQIVILSRRIDHADGSFAGIVLATIGVSFFQDFYDAFDIGPHGGVALAALDGVILARRPLDPSPNGSNLASSPLFRTYVPRSFAGNFEVVGRVDGQARIGSFRRLERYPLLIVVSRRKTAVLAAWQSEAVGQLAVLAGVTGLIALLGAVLARQVRARQTTEALYRLLADHSGDAIVCISLDGFRRYASPAFLTMTGWSAAEVIGQRAVDIILPEDRAIFLDALARLGVTGDRAMCSFRYRRRDGSPLWVEIQLQLVRGQSGTPTECVGNVRDITERKRLEERLLGAISQLRLLSTTDALTGLANRRHFDAALGHEWRRAERERHPLALLLMDADCFKIYNDTYGHPAGDAVLRAIADTCRGELRRPADLAARYGGEEFALLLPATDAIGATMVAEQIREAMLERGIAHVGLEWGMATISVGVAAALPGEPGGATSPAALLQEADQALYDAKRGGRNKVSVARVLASS